MVDYAIYLEPSSDIRRRIKKTFETLPLEENFLNQTSYAPLKAAPIIINVETNPPFIGGPKADQQLTGWQDVGEAKLKELFAANGNNNAQIPTMPLISFYGYDAYLSG